MNISELSVKRPTLIVVIFTVLTFLGIMGLRNLNYELLPKYTSPIFTVTTLYPGAAPAEVESNVSKKIEEALSTIENLDIIRSISTNGVSLVVVTLKLDAQIEDALNNATRKIQSIKSSLPPGAKEPAINPISIDEMPVMSLGLCSSLSNTELYDLYKERIEPRFSKIEGVATITLIGETPKEIQVNVNNQKLSKAGISILQIVKVISDAGISYPAGMIQNENNQNNIRIEGKIKDITKLRKLPVATMQDGSITRLEDIAKIIETEKDPKTLFKINGEQSFGIEISKMQDANSVEVCSLIKEELGILEKEYHSKELTFSILQDSSILIKDAADGVAKDLIMAILLVTIIMIAFLRSERNALIIMISVPLSLISTIIGLQIFDYTLNLMTLLGLSVIIGTLVDDAIVVLENIYRHIEMGKPRMKATLDGVKEVLNTVISTSMVLIVVFLPVVLSDSIISPVVGPFAMVIVIAVIISTFAALTLIPLLTSRFANESVKTKPRRNGNKNEEPDFLSSLKLKLGKWFESIIERFTEILMNFLKWTLRHKIATLILTLILFLSSFLLIAKGFIGSEFLSMGDVGEGVITIKYPKDYTLKKNNLNTAEIEKFIATKKEVVSLYSSIGLSGSILAIQQENNESQIRVKLCDKEERDISSSYFFKNLENEINSKFPEVKARGGIVTLMGSVDEDPIQIVFRGTQKDSLMAFANRMVEKVKQIPGTSNVKLSIEEGSPEILIKFDEHRMALHNVSRENAGATIMTSFAGNTDTKLSRGEIDYDINVRLDQVDRRNLEDVKRIPITNNLGIPVQLEDIALVSEQYGDSRLERYGRISSVTLESQAIGKAIGDVGAEVLALIENENIPEGIDYLTESELKYQGDAFGSLGIAFFIAVVLVYLIMVALYESYRDPLVVMFSIPLSIIGALYALALTNQSLSIFSIMGIIMLAGLVTKNAILVVDFANQLLKRENNLNPEDYLNNNLTHDNHSHNSNLKQKNTKNTQIDILNHNYQIFKALLTAVRLRIRPILMTAVSTVIGMLPIALSNAPGSEWKKRNGMGTNWRNPKLNATLLDNSADYLLDISLKIQ